MTLAEVRTYDSVVRSAPPLLVQRFSALLDRWQLEEQADGVLVVSDTVRGAEVVAFATEP